MSKGYFFDKRRGKWRARAVRDGKYVHLGYHATETEAHTAYLAGRGDNDVAPRPTVEQNTRALANYFTSRGRMKVGGDLHQLIGADT